MTTITNKKGKMTINIENNTIRVSLIQSALPLIQLHAH